MNTSTTSAKGAVNPEIGKSIDISGYSVNYLDEIVESRYRASIRSGYQESCARLFQEPHREQLDALCMPKEEIGQLDKPVLLLHGREDVIVPLDCSLRAHALLKNSDLHVFGNCAHWTQIEKAAHFGQLMRGFLDRTTLKGLDS